ncbi:MAG: hypothetical protein COT73_09760 [Bdellovibrio sp. CG10_big_fil_rev_8_21_14_0_10_47_8]|nr:MAG: hypothetical protein COT73_09760 [Bdellovibrio sp. CG10_big_fil_rev_8_21_14_0_10_47_8]
MSLSLRAQLGLFLFLFAACAKDDNSHFSPEKPTPEGSAPAILRDYGDIVRNQEDFKSLGLLNDPSLTSVTAEFGPSVIQTTGLPFKSSLAMASVKPWSSWWYPKKDQDLFADTAGVRSAPLTKFDYFQLSRNSRSGSSAEYERKTYDPNAARWEGLCDAWALASIVLPEPQRPVRIYVERPIATWLTFSVGDLKALSLKTFEAVQESDLKYYGQKFTGDYNGWIYPDLFPEQFHRFLEVYLFQKKQAFIMDHDAGVEVWNVPVYKANFNISSIPDEPNSLFVQTWLYSAESVQANDKNFVGTREAVREYNYVLQGVRDSNGNLVINGGYWVKGPTGIDSRKDHPDYLIAVPDPNKLVRQSWNPQIDIQLVDEILSKSY